MKNIIIRKSKISGKGVFALRDFKKGEVVLKWHPNFIKKKEIEKLSNKKINYLYKIGKRYVIMQSPERYVNHSCEANTKALNNCDIAIRDINKNEEITANYSKDFSSISFKCNCGSKKCKINIQSLQ